MKSLLFILVPLSFNLYAEDVSQFSEVLVLGAKDAVLKESDVSIGQDEINANLVSDVNDLVSNEPGVSVVQKSNSGTSGFNIRGVEQDRVAILVDGIHQGETFENDIYVGYGYFDGSINEIELDSVKTVNINKGTDSLFTGSGSLGGAVSYETKEASDLISSNKDFGLYNKTIYSSSRSEFKTTSGIALQQDYGDLLLLYTYTKGREQKTKDSGYDIYGKARSKPDPLRKKSDNILVKSNIILNDNHILKLTYENFSVDKFVDERSWELFGFNHRLYNSEGERTRYSIDWNYDKDGKYIQNIDTKIFYQKIKQKKISSVYKFDNNELEQIYDRSQDQKSIGFNQNFEFSKMNVISLPFTQTLIYGFNKKSFENNNTDILFLNKTYVTNNSIIEPVDTKHYHFAYLNEFDVSDFQTLSMGVRYDNYRNKVKTNGKSISTPHYSKSFPKPEDTSFDGISASVRYDLQVNDPLRLSYKVSSGFRAPNPNELYFSYGNEIAANRVEPNPDLKDEKGITNEILIRYSKEDLAWSVSPFYTTYKDFIDLKAEQKLVPNPWYDPITFPKKYLEQNHLQYKNVDSAYIYGIDLRFKVDLSTYLLLDNQLWFNSAFNYSKGKGSDGDSLISVQPWQVNGSFKYVSNNYDLNLRSMYISEKKAEDTIRDGKEWGYVNDSVFLLDLIANYRITKNFTMNAGIFNILDKKYKTWDSVRSIPKFGSTNMVDQDGLGLNRFTAPGINWKIGLEVKL
ncbi:TonB-dependent hemoglobin/transferrin/lactoferrin family receptor [Vibrio harveyi]